MSGKLNNSTKDKKNKKEILDRKIESIIEALKKIQKGYLIFGLDMAADDDKKGLCVLGCDENLEILELMIAVTWKEFAIPKNKNESFEDILIKIIKGISGSDSNVQVFWVVDIPFGWPAGFAKSVGEINANEELAGKINATNIGSSVGSMVMDVSQSNEGLAIKEEDSGNEDKKVEPKTCACVQYAEVMDNRNFFERICETTMKKLRFQNSCLNVAADKIAIPAYEFATEFKKKVIGKRNTKIVLGFRNVEQNNLGNNDLLMETYPAAFIENMDKENCIGYEFRNLYKNKNQVVSPMIRLVLFFSLCRIYKLRNSDNLCEQFNKIANLFCNDSCQNIIKNNKTFKDIIKSIHKLICEKITPKFVQDFNNPNLIEVIYKRDDNEDKDKIKTLQKIEFECKSNSFISKINNNDHIFDGFLCALSGYDYLRWAKNENIGIKLFSPELLFNKISCNAKCLPENSCEKKALTKKIENEGWFVFRYWPMESNKYRELIKEFLESKGFEVEANENKPWEIKHKNGLMFRVEFDNDGKNIQYKQEKTNPIRLESIRPNESELEKFFLRIINGQDLLFSWIKKTFLDIFSISEDERSKDEFKKIDSHICEKSQEVLNGKFEFKKLRTFEETKNKLKIIIIKKLLNEIKHVKIVKKKKNVYKIHKKEGEITERNIFDYWYKEKLYIFS